jgi:hypothetical protein
VYYAAVADCRYALQFKLIPDPLTCTPRDVFLPHFYDLPAFLARLIGQDQIQLLPIQVRCAAAMAWKAK